MKDATGIRLKMYVRIGYRIWAWLLAIASGAALCFYTGSEAAVLWMMKALCVCSGITGLVGTFIARLLRG